MPLYAHPTVLANGPARILSACTRIAIISSYTFGDDYATVVSRILASRAVTPADFDLVTVDDDAVLTSDPGPSDAVASAGGGGASSHFAFLDDVNNLVLRVTEESSDQTIVAGNPVDFPATVYTVSQPTA